MARPVPASAAATVSTNIAKTWPTRSLSTVEKATKLMLTASSISSIDIMIMMTFLRLRKMPKIPSVNRIAATIRKWARPIGILSIPYPAADRYLNDLARFGAGARQLPRYRLMPHANTRPQCQDNRADHRDEQDHAGRLEGEDVAGVEQFAECPGVCQCASIGR